MSAKRLFVDASADTKAKLDTFEDGVLKGLPRITLPANALEPDLNILPAGSVAGIPCNPPPGLCFEDNPDGIVMYHDHVALTTRIPTTLENYLDDLHQRAVDNPQLALILFDVKPSVAELPKTPQ